MHFLGKMLPRLELMHFSSDDIIELIVGECGVGGQWMKVVDDLLKTVFDS